MRKKTGRLLAFGLILSLLLILGTAAADGMHTEIDNEQLDVEVRLGYDGRITYGKPVPVRVTVRNRGEDLEGILAVNAYASIEYYDRFETEISVPAGGERTAVLAVEANTRQDVFTVEILQDGKVIHAVNVSPEGVINPSAMMIGLLSTRPRNLANLDITQENDPLNRYEFWQTVALTPEMFPDDAELLDSFGMIVLDDTDPSLLTDKQQNALKNWVREGHILLCGGGAAAPRNLVFMGDMTPLKAEGFIVSDGVHDALESYAGRKATARRPSITLAQITGMDPIAADEDGNGLIWRVTVGSGCIYVLAWEAGDAALNTESLMHLFYQQMLIKADLSLYNSVLYNQKRTTATYSPGGYSQLKVRNTLPLAAAIVAAAALAGFVLWIVLNRHGESKWMWAVLPLIALAAAACITVMSGSSMLNGPAASAAVNIVQSADGGVTHYTAITAAAPKAGIHRYSMEGEKLDVVMWNEAYWPEEDEENTPKEPGKLRIVRKSGERNEAAFNASSPWEETELTAVRTEAETGAVRAEVWMEDDGLHGTVYNGTSLQLKEGAVLCVWGFAKILALAPGESADFALIAEDISDPYNPVFKDGKMLRNASSSMYTVIQQMYFGTRGEYPYENREGILANMISNAVNELVERKGITGGNGQESTVFAYCAEPEEVIVPAIYADGKEIESKSVLPMLTAEMDYLTVGRTGVVFHAPGMDKAVRCALDEEGLPAGDMQEDPYQGRYYSSYYALSEMPTFRFTPESLQEIEISKLIIGMEQWYLSDAECYVLNVKYGQWEEIQLNTPLVKPERYLDSKGNLYCQLRSVSGEYYTEIPAPTLTLEGRVKNASAR